MAAGKKNQDRSCILVMGMHRSGTSALGGMLGFLGNDLPQTPMPKTEDNPKGYFESYPIYFFNEDLLKAVGSGWDDWRALDMRGDFPGRADFENRARALLEQEFGGASQFVFKDPRNCRLGDFWLPLLREQGCRIVALHTLRSPWEVVTSLTGRDKMLPEQGLLLWLRHTLDAERLTRGLPRYQTSYDLLMQDWRSVAEEAGAALGLHWKRSPAAAAAEIDAFLARGLRHFEMVPPAESALWTWVREVHDILQAWSQSGEVTADHARLDEICRQFDAAEPVLAALLSMATARQDRFHALEEAAAALSARAESDRQRASHQLAEMQTRSDRLRLEEEERHQREMMTLKARYAQSRNQAQALRDQLAARLPVLERDLQKALAERARYQSEATALRGSTSWRITAPLRRVIAVLRRKKPASRGG
jgi:hypothetical protein